MSGVLIKSLEPIIPSEPMILVLGSMPGAESLRLQQYYAFKRNFFWPIMYKLLCARERNPWDESYEERVRLLDKAHIALWDVLQTCSRRGSLDQTIREVIPNPINRMIAENPTIKGIFCNGSKAYDQLRKLAGENRTDLDKKSFSWDQVTAHKMPSTSPVPSKNYRTMQDRLRVWERLYTYLPIS